MTPGGPTRKSGVKISKRISARPESFVVPVQPAAIELLSDLSNILRRWGPWYLFGAQAVIAHGVPRLSADVDVTVELTPDDPERFANEMKAAGFDLLVDDPEFIRKTRVMPFVHRPTAMPLDVVLAGSGLEQEFLGRAKATDVGGVVVPLIQPEDLIIAKIVAGRPKDLEDAKGLWRIHGRRLDATRIRGILRVLEEALSQSDLMPAFESIAE